MKVRLRTTLAGPAGTAQPGDVIDLPKGEAYALIEGGFAAQIEPEAAVIEQPENTARPRARPRG